MRHACPMGVSRWDFTALPQAACSRLLTKLGGRTGQALLWGALRSVHLWHLAISARLVVVQGACPARPTCPACWSCSPTALPRRGAPTAPRSCTWGPLLQSFLAGRSRIGRYTQQVRGQRDIDSWRVQQCCGHQEPPRNGWWHPAHLARLTAAQLQLLLGPG
jgi:hypothetical protein